MRKNLSTPDSIHIATALLYKCYCFLTYDNGKSDKGIPILTVGENGKFANKVIKIQKPTTIHLL